MQFSYSADFGIGCLKDNKKTLPKCLSIKIFVIFALPSAVGRQPDFKDYGKIY